jgi:Flp pilus assembly protein TadD
LETGADGHIYDNERRQAEKLANEGKYGEAISTMLDVITNTKPKTSDYNNLGYYYIFSKQFSKAVKYLKEGIKLDDTDLLIQGNLAHAYLFNGDLEQAKIIYVKYKTQNVDDKMSWVDMIKLDFIDFKKAGLPSDNFQSILDLVQ